MGKNSKAKKNKVQSPLLSGNDTKKHFISPQKRHERDVLIQELLKITTRTPHEKCNVQVVVELKKILSKIEPLECADSPIDNDRSSHFAKLLEWVAAAGGDISNVIIQGIDDDMDYGLFAKNDIKLQDLVCSIPRKVMMTSESAKNSELEYLLKHDKMLSVMNNVSLAVFLCLEAVKGSNSFWYPYIQSLPNKYDTILYFEVEDFQLLKGSTVYEPVLLQFSHICRQYAYLKNLFDNSNDPASLLLRNLFSFAFYRWAVSTVLTRQNVIPSTDGTKSINALIPVWDMCNHMPGSITTGFNEEIDCSECFACQDFLAGSQIFISYGMRSNADFFVHNGFVPDKNPYDVYKLKLGIAKADPLQGLRNQTLVRLNLPSCGEFPIKGGTDPIEGDLLAFLRVFSMEKEDLQFWLDSDKPDDLKFMDCALDTRVEIRMWSFFTSRLKLLLSVYPNISQDVSYSPCGKLAVRFIEAEKALLTNALEYARLKAEH